MNSLGDTGAKMMVDVIKQTKSLVTLNLASNDISAAGLSLVFDAMQFNESITHLDLSTIEGANRNRMNKKTMPYFKNMLINNVILETLVLINVNIGNNGMHAI